MGHPLLGPEESHDQGGAAVFRETRAMGQTYRDGRAASHSWRKPRGSRQALVNAVRPRTAPPPEFDDVALNRDCWAPCRAARRMRAACMSQADIIYRLMRKFRMDYASAAKVVEWEFRYGWGR